MKNMFFSISIFSIISASVLTGCTTPAEKVEAAQVNVQVANEALDKANHDLMLDIEVYRAEMSAKVAENERMIAEYKLKVKNEREDQSAARKLRIAELEQKNENIRTRVYEYKGEGNENWEKFKTEFNRDMNELGQSLADLTRTNVK